MMAESISIIHLRHYINFVFKKIIFCSNRKRNKSFQRKTLIIKNDEYQFRSGKTSFFVVVVVVTKDRSD